MVIFPEWEEERKTGRIKDWKKERLEERKIELNDRVRIMTFVKDSRFMCFLFPLEDV